MKENSMPKNLRKLLHEKDSLVQLCVATYGGYMWWVCSILNPNASIQMYSKNSSFIALQSNSYTCSTFV